MSRLIKGLLVMASCMTLVAGAAAQGHGNHGNQGHGNHGRQGQGHGNQTRGHGNMNRGPQTRGNQTRGHGNMNRGHQTRGNQVRGNRVGGSLARGRSGYRVQGPPNRVQRTGQVHWTRDRAVKVWGSNVHHYADRTWDPGQGRFVGYHPAIPQGWRRERADCPIPDWSEPIYHVGIGYRWRHIPGNFYIVWIDGDEAYYYPDYGVYCWADNPCLVVGYYRPELVDIPPGLYVSFVTRL